MPSINPTKLKRSDNLSITANKEGKPLTSTPVTIDVVNNLDKTEISNDKGQVTIKPNQRQNVIGLKLTC
ncbi:hypothetical protein [uncultured Gilliamella sp.]|uniref:hypothetical protein n=1 Tax=uncultured Gilliamella sp. TaxID=1193505 RepID=UPI0025FA1497|nr:hypothetical protein [uncultured Gilliamella sp.]